MKNWVFLLFSLFFFHVSGFNKITLYNDTDYLLKVLPANHHKYSEDTIHHFLLIPAHESITIVINSPILLWFWNNNAAFTVIRDRDKVLSFVENDTIIRIISGKSQRIKLTNSHEECAFVNTINPDEDNIDCNDCADTCYNRRGTLIHCSCLGYCHDRSRDLHWILQPYERKYIRGPEDKNLRTQVYEDEETIKRYRHYTYYY